MADFNKVYSNTEKRIDTLLLNSSSMLEKSIKKLEENIVSRSASILDIGKAGDIKAQKELSRAVKFHKELAKEFESTYGSTIQKSSKSFLDIQSTVRNEFKGLDLPYSFGAADKDMFESLRRSAAGGLQHLGDDAMGKIAQATYSAVITGQSFGLFVKNVRDQMGSLGKYAQTRAHDSLMDYYTDLNIKKAGDAGIETFLYYGNIVRASRPFCIARVGMVFTIKQIQEWDKLSWAGKRPGPTLINRGGYNCRHSLHPCDPEWVEDGKVKVQSWWDQKGKMDPKLVEQVRKEAKKMRILPPKEIKKRLKPISEPIFKPAKTIKEAQSWAIKNNLAKDVKYGKVDVSFANTINHSLSKLIKENKIPYDEIKVVNRKSGGWEGIFLTNTLKINPTTLKAQRRTLTINNGALSAHGDTKALDKYLKKSYENRFLVAESLEDLVNHEYGHNLTVLEILKKRRKDPGGFRMDYIPIYDSKNLSQYATYDFGESLAEVFCKYKKGELIKREWKEMFNEFSEVKIK